MTTPQFPPAGRDPQDESPTQPIGAPPSSTGIPAFEPVAPEEVSAPITTPATPAQVRSRSRSGGSGLLNIALGVALVVATAGIAFAVGRSTAPAAMATVGVSAPEQIGNLPGASFDPDGGGLPGNGGGLPGNAGNGSGPRGGFALGGGITIEGTVDSMTADSVTVKTEGGETITVGLDTDTTYHQQAAATSADVETGATVIVRLEGGFRPGANGDGSGAGATLGSAGDVTVVP
jgi:hypothetical protein